MFCGRVNVLPWIQRIENDKIQEAFNCREDDQH